MEQYYKIIYRKKADPDVWFLKCVCRTRDQAERFKDVLEQVSDVYAELKVLPVSVSVPGMAN